MQGSWKVTVATEVSTWLLGLPESAYARVVASIQALEERGPTLGRPLVDSIRGSNVPHLKELRMGTMRVLFFFGAERTAVLLVTGDKRDRWSQWYREAIPTAEERMARWNRRETR
jgi:hypothetical protein